MHNYAHTVEFKQLFIYSSFNFWVDIVNVAKCGENINTIFWSKILCPELQFDMHLCTKFTHCPKKCHTESIKKIYRYFNEILLWDEEKKGMTWNFKEMINLVWIVT